MCLIPALAWAGKLRLPKFLRADKPTEEAVAVEAQAPQPEVVEPEIPRHEGDLFEGALPIAMGATPEGLANLSAQGCHACHAASHDGWASGPHSRSPSQALRDAVATTGATACLSCHLPLQQQHDTAPTWNDEPGPINAGFDATLHLEGVTCAACHVRDGRVLVATEAAAQGVSNHLVAHSPALTDGAMCASCHQLTWPGANVPLYDTYGEWSRSAWAEAGVGCVDCHRDTSGPHRWIEAPDRAVSLLIDTPSTRIVRGAKEPVSVSLTLQNTGAGHSWPTGTPFRGVRLKATWMKPAKNGLEVDDATFTADLMRTLEDAAPWSTIEDTRLTAGESRSFSFERRFGTREPAGTWQLVVELQPLLYGEPEGEPVVTRRLLLHVE